MAQSDQRAFINLRLGSQAFRKFVKAQYVDGLRLFQLLSYWRRDMAHATSSKVDEIAYLQIAAGLLSYALGIKSYDLNIRLKSFTADEKDFLLAPLKKHEYYTSYKMLLDRLFKNVPAFDDECELFLRLQIFGRRQSVSLATEEKLVKVVQGLTAMTREELDSRYFDFTGKSARSHATNQYKIGQTVGTSTYIVYFAATGDGRPPHDIYCEFAAAPGIVFKVWSDIFIRFANSAIFELVFEYNKHLLQLIPAFYELLLFIPGIVEEGLYGLVRILIDQVAQKGAEEVLEQLGFDPEKAGLWLGGLALLTHKVKTATAKRPVYSPSDIELGPGGAVAGDLALAETRGIAHPGKDLAATEARTIEGDTTAVTPPPVPPKPIEIVDVKAQLPPPTGTQISPQWLDKSQKAMEQADRAAVAKTMQSVEVDQRALAKTGTAIEESEEAIAEAKPARAKKTAGGGLEAEEYRAEPASSKQKRKKAGRRSRQQTRRKISMQPVARARNRAVRTLVWAPQRAPSMTRSRT